MLARRILPSCLTLVVILIAGCSQAPAGQPVQTVVTQSRETSTSAPADSATDILQPPPTATLTPVKVTCADGGRIREGVVPDTGSFGREMPFLIYLPPCYERSDRGWPTLYLLHGLAGSAGDWLDLGIVAAADKVIDEGNSAGFLIVMPWQQTGLQFESALVEGLLPQIEREYGGLPGRTWRAIGGISRGGGWAFRLGFRHSADFSAIGLHSPAVMAGDLAALPRWLDQSSGQRTPRVWIDIGASDSLLANVDELRARLEAEGVEFEYSSGEGGHEASYWSARLVEYLRWYSSRW